jgi:hypothetical protein
MFEVAEVRCPPQARAQGFARYDFTRGLEQRNKDFEGLVRETEPSAVLVQFTSADVDLERSEPQFVEGPTRLHTAGRWRVV